MMQQYYIHKKFLFRFGDAISNLRHPLILWKELRNEGRLEKLRMAEDWFIGCFKYIYMEFECENTFKQREKSLFFTIINGKEIYDEKQSVDREFWDAICTHMNKIMEICDNQFMCKPLLDEINGIAKLISKI